MRIGLPLSQLKKECPMGDEYGVLNTLKKIYSTIKVNFLEHLAGKIRIGLRYTQEDGLGHGFVVF